MRVKLFYTVEEEEVLGDSAKILNLSTDQLQKAVNLFADIQRELEADEATVNITKCLNMIMNCREALYNVDMRCAEVAEIVEAYDSYRQTKKAGAPPPGGAATAPVTDPDLEAVLLGDG